MSEKKCSRCGSEMGLGAPSAENVKIQYECWCGNVEAELFAEDELSLEPVAPVVENAKPSSAAAG